MNDKKIQTPSQFYRRRRPEYFSDSKIVAKAILPREQLDYEISQISTTQKQDSFENLCRKLAEKLITPNLIPQVGPTGGGDGKTDAETYPVSNFISERWFVSDNKWNENENWAFAMSAKKDWKTKVKSDVKGIIDTNRGYTRIYFFSNQKISSKNKKETQAQIKKDFGIELVILDAEWILEKVYSNNLLNDVIEALNLSRIYIEEKIVGANDSERITKLSDLENKINSIDRTFEVDYQLVEDCLESAITSRMLELPKTEVIGKFNRAKRFANKLNNLQLKVRVHYQLAWTFINWYDDYRGFFTEYLELKKMVSVEPNLNNLELYLNLYNILRTVSTIEDAQNLIVIDFIKEEKDFVSLLTKCSNDKNKLSTALLSKFYLSFIIIANNFQNEGVASDELIKLKEYFETSKQHLDIPFEQLKEIIEIFGKLLPSNKEFDNLIDVIAEIESVRVSELSSGEIYLNRGITKLQNNYDRDSLIYFGKAARKLAKEETQTSFYYCLMLLSDAYSKLDLYWASYNALVCAANIYVNNFYTAGKLNPRFLKSIKAILRNESFIGRVPIILCWYELFDVLKQYLQDDNQDDDNELPTEHLIDACLAIRLLNAPFEKFRRFTYLPDILHNNNLWLSGDAVLYLLGNEDLIELDEIKTSLKKEKFPEYYSNFANQPFVEQIIYETNLLDNEEISVETHVLGIKLIAKLNRNTELLILSETILAYLESFLATAFDGVFPLSEKITLNISYGSIDNFFGFTSDTKGVFNLFINESHAYKGKDIAELMDEILPQIIGNNYGFKDYKQFFENLYKNDEVSERLSIILEHRNFLTNILTAKPKFFLKDWKSDSIKNYEVNRKSSPILIKEISEKNTEEKPDWSKITHKNLRAETIIDSPLWDKAKWQGFGFAVFPKLPFVIFLGFENGEAGRKIFEGWINEYGRVDHNEVISLTIVKGINKENPNWYKILVSKKIDKEKMKDGNLVSISSRFHKMEPQENTNLTNLIASYQHYKKYVLIPAEIDQDIKVQPYPELGILKTELKIIDAWTIGIHDFERVVITEDDNPIIPDDIPNAPIIEVLKEKLNKRR
ncbi:MAG: hypothetical protein ACTHM7_21770 [Ginsengibacter sp.]